MPVQDLIRPGFEPVAAQFRAWIETDRTYSGQLAVYHRGEPVLDLTIGDHEDYRRSDRRRLELSAAIRMCAAAAA